MLMAYRARVVRGICRLVSTTRLTRVRPGAVSIPGWTHTASACYSTQCLLSEGPNTSRLRPQWRKAELLACRKYSEDAAMSLSELKESVLKVLKMFDKINPDKVSKMCVFVVKYSHEICTVGQFASTLCKRLWFGQFGCCRNCHGIRG